MNKAKTNDLPRKRSFAKAKAASTHVNEAGGYVCQKADPRDARTAAAGFDGAGKLVAIQKTRKINAGMSTERVIAPGASVDIQQLELTVSRIELELDFNQAIVID